jgi:hypothetical protein
MNRLTYPTASDSFEGNSDKKPDKADEKHFFIFVACHKSLL